MVNHREDIPPQLKGIGLPHVDYVLCLNDTDGHWNTMAEVVAPQGHTCSIVETSAPVDIRLLMVKSASFSWELMFTADDKLVWVGQSNTMNPSKVSGVPVPGE